MIGRVFRILRVPVTLLVLLGVLAYGWWWGYTNVLRPIPPAPPQKCVNQPVEKGQLRSSQVTVSVYNGGSRRGLAGDVGRSLREKGFKVQRATNTQEKINKTVIVGVNAKNPEVIMVKGFLKGAVVRVDKAKTDRSVDVLVGNKYGGFNKKAKTTLAVKSKSVCLPSQASTPGLGG